MPVGTQARSVVRIERDFHFRERHVHSHAHMGAKAKAEQRAHRALQPQTVGVFIGFRIAIGCGDGENDSRSLGKFRAVYLNVPRGNAGHCPCRRVAPHGFADSLWDERAILSDLL